VYFNEIQFKIYILIQTPPEMCNFELNKTLLELIYLLHLIRIYNLFLYNLVHALKKKLQPHDNPEFNYNNKSFRYIIKDTHYNDVHMKLGNLA